MKFLKILITFFPGIMLISFEDGFASSTEVPGNSPRLLTPEELSHLRKEFQKCSKKFKKNYGETIKDVLINTPQKTLNIEENSTKMASLFDPVIQEIKKKHQFQNEKDGLLKYANLLLKMCKLIPTCEWEFIGGPEYKWKKTKYQNGVITTHIITKNWKEGYSHTQSDCDHY